MIEMRWAVSDGNAKLQYRNLGPSAGMVQGHVYYSPDDAGPWTDVPLVQLAAEKVLEAQDAVEEDVVEEFPSMPESEGYMGGER